MQYLLQDVVQICEFQILHITFRISHITWQIAQVTLSMCYFACHIFHVIFDPLLIQNTQKVDYYEIFESKSNCKAETLTIFAQNWPMLS